MNVITTTRPTVPITGRQLTTMEACEYLRVSVRTLYRLVRQHRVRRVMFGCRAVRYPQKELDRVLEASTKAMR